MTEGAVPPLFEAVIVPHRSLSRRGLAVLISVLCVLSGGIALGAASLGAWPVSGFAGAEVGAAALLLLLSGRRSTPVQILVLTASEFRIVRIDGRRRPTERRLPAGWLAVSIRQRPGRVPAVIVSTHGVEEEIAEVLGEAEKLDLARTLRDTLDEMRQPRLM
jgi:uncharacterized membrane protein